MDYRLEVVTPATTEPITVAEAAAWLRVDDPDFEQARIVSSLAAARHLLESVTGQRFGSQTLRLWLPCFPDDDDWEFPIAPITAVTGISYYNTSDVGTALSTIWYHTADAEPPYESTLTLKYAQVWPAVTLRPVDGVSITVTCGHATIPPLLKIAYLQLAAHYFQNPSATVVVDRAQATAVEIPHGAMAILNSFRLYAD